MPTYSALSVQGALNGLKGKYTVSVGEMWSKPLVCCVVRAPHWRLRHPFVSSRSRQLVPFEDTASRDLSHINSHRTAADLSNIPAHGETYGVQGL